MLLGAVFLLIASSFAHRSAGVALASSTLTRPEDPVVMTGADLPSFGGLAPNLLVAFKHTGSAWVQVPVQVDERDLVDFCDIYNSTEPCGTITLQYTDPNTWTGADSNPTIDANDEIVFMSKDADGVAPAFSEPAGVVAGSGVQVTVTDPLHPGQTGYVYLFRQTGSLDPGAGAAYVVYNFLLVSGDYKTTYVLQGGGGNPENTLAFSASYGYHFGDRWQEDQLLVTAGTATGADILDRHKPMFAPGQCVRTEDSFDGLTATSPIEGAFVANKSGPVRAIRSFVGANSGPLTQREHVFYAERQDIRTYLRVHTIPSVMDFFDYSPAASGMTYYNSLNPGGFLIDGVPDSPVAGAPAWEIVNGPQGAVVHAGSVSTNWAGFNYTSYYLDDQSPPVTQCTGDGFAYGSSGVYVNPSGSPQIPNTDPSIGGTTFLNSTRFMYFKSPYASGPAATAAASALSQGALTPLTYAVAPFTGGGDSDGDGVVDANDNCPADVNPGQDNNDRNFISNAPVYVVHDQTAIMSDTAGDACDADDDNDGVADTAEAAGCNGSSALNALSADTDGDRFLDGPECVRGTNPASAASVPTLASCGATTDADGDGLSERIEACFYNSNPASANSDGDTCGDGREVASLNVDQTVNSIDQGLLAAELLRMPPPPKLRNMDLNKDGVINSLDQGFQASRIGACP